MLKARMTFVFLFYTLNLLSQEAGILWCNKIDEAKGLSSQEYNFYSFTDTEGFNWISSTKGLNRFDGHQIKQYRTDIDNDETLFGENIQNRPIEDADKNFWICSYEALHFYDRKHDRFRRFFVKDSNGDLIKEDYLAFYLEKNKFLWFRAKNNVYRIDVSDIEKVESEISNAQPIFISKNYHFFVGLDDDENVNYIFSTSNGKRKEILETSIISQGKFIPKEYPIELKNQLAKLSVFQCQYFSEEEIWISSNNGLAKLNLESNQLQHFPFPKDKSSYFVPINDQYFIVSFYTSGLFLFDKKTGNYTPYEVRDLEDSGMIIRKKIRNLFLDKNKVLWLTVKDHGVFFTQINKRKFNFLPKSNQHKTSSKYLNLFKTKKDEILVSNLSEISLIDKSGKKILDFSTDGLPNILTLFKKESNDTLWIGTGNGLYNLDVKNNRRAKINGTEGFYFLSIHQLNDGNILASTLNDKLLFLKKENNIWESEIIEVSDVKNPIYTTIYQDSFGKIYICRNESMVDVFDYKNGQIIFSEHLPIRGSVFSFHENKKDNFLYIGTSYGLVKLEKTNFNSKIELFTINDGLLDNNIFNIQSNSKDELWISTFKGISLFDKKEKSFHNFSLSDGQGSNNFFPFAGTKLSDGSIYFGGENGITKIPSNKIEFLQNKPNILLSQLKIDDEIPDSIFCKKTNATNINQIQVLEYTYKNNTISFNISASDFADPNSVKLRYKLNPIDENWVEVENTFPVFVRFSNLESGNYQFEIEARNSDGNINSIAYRNIDINILPPIWERTWFRVLASLFILFLGYLIVRYRLNQIKEKEQLKTKIAINKMSALVGQMNPHFIFNSLNSINRYILKENRILASEYLGRFSGLMRKMLENSRTNKHALSTEIEFLELYMKVESQRFKKPFEHHFEIDSQIDEYNTDIPTMMLQPFIENSIWHGISNLDKTGKIKIEIIKVKKLIKCIIEDNGVGRKKAKELGQKEKGHDSTALTIVEERLQLLFPNQKELCSIQFEDLEDKIGNAIGTKVTITLPFID